MNIIGFLISFGLLIIAITAHEFAHGWVAYKLGDNTAKFSGRLTLNPFAHIDPIGTIILPFFLYITTGFIFGWAKPVPINYWALRNPKKDIIWVGASGPVANFIFALALTLLVRLLPLSANLSNLIVQLITINVLLGVFNLIPIPPLDGSRILSGLLPRELSLRYSQIEPYGFIILILLMWLGVINHIIFPLVNLILRLLGLSL